jgi:hypothetical protein
MLGNRIIGAEVAMLRAMPSGPASVLHGGAPRNPVSTQQGIVASPRIWRVDAPVRRTVVDALSIGATEDFPRAEGFALGVGTHAVLASHSDTDVARGDEADKRMGMSVTLPGCRARKRAPGRCTDRCLANGFTPDGSVETETWDSEEGALCPWIAIGTDGMHDVPSDSGIVQTGDPGVLSRRG